MKPHLDISVSCLYLFMQNQGGTAWMIMVLYLDVCNEVLFLYNQPVELVLQGRHSLDYASINGGEIHVDDLWWTQYTQNWEQILCLN